MNISTSVIETALDLALGTSDYNGVYATILTNREVLIWNGSAYVYTTPIPLLIDIPNPIVNTSPNITDTLGWIYDIGGYDNILVTATL
jgi:hypothetical protein